MNKHQIQLLFKSILLKAKSRSGIIAISLLILFLATRLLYLDRDVPPWDVTVYSSLDEQLYTIPAFNMYNYGKMKHQVVDWVSDDMLIFNNSMLGNLMTFVTLKIFGNNYYGLRITPVLASLIVVVFLLKIMLMQNPTGKKPKKVQNAAMIAYITVAFFIIFNFPFLIASRIYEPTIIRMMVMLILMYLAGKHLSENKRLRYNEVFLFGVFSGLGVWAVYFTNLFFIPALGLFLLIQGQNKGWRNTSLYLILYSSGILASMLFYTAVYYGIYDQFYFKEMLHNLNDPLWGGRRVKVIGSEISIGLIQDMWNNANKIMKTNIFSMNSVLLTLFYTSLPIFIYRLIKFRRNTDLIIGCMILFLFIQTLFINDFYKRKLIILFPLIILVIYSAIIEIINTLNRGNTNIIIRYYIMYGLIIIFGIKILSLAQRIFGNYYYRYYEPGSIRILEHLGIPIDESTLVKVVILIIASMVIYKAYSSSINFQPALIGIIASIIYLFLLMPELNNSYTYIYSKPEFKHRDSMRSISKLIEGKKGSGFALGMRLYTQSTPYYNGYVHSYKKGDLTDDRMKILAEDGQLDYMLNRKQKSGEYNRFMETINFRLVKVLQLPIYGEVGLWMKN